MARSASGTRTRLGGLQEREYVEMQTGRQAETFRPSVWTWIPGDVVLR